MGRATNPQAGESRRLGPGGPVGDGLRPRKHENPTPDQMYLGSKLNRMDFTQDTDGPIIKVEHQITAAALQRWIVIYGSERVSSALRVAWGFPPLGGIANPYAYVGGILRGMK